jgi:RNA polymerase sigma factor (sigma-70 family)
MRSDRPEDAGSPRFPATRLSVLRAAQDADPDVRSRALETLLASYWTPLYKYFRVAWHVSPEDAADLTQQLFARALESATFEAYEPSKGRFRTYLRSCADHLAANERKAEARKKRGGGAARVSLDIAGVEEELLASMPAQPFDADEYLHKEWVRGVCAAAIEALRSLCAGRGRHEVFEVFRRYDLDGSDAVARPTYPELARELGLPVTQVTNYLCAARRDFRRLVLAEIRRATVSEAEYRLEVRHVLGIEAP